MKSESLSKFFYPKSLCVAGASTKEKSIGYELLKCIKKYGYTGKVFPVNPKADSVLDYKCYKSIDDITEQIDLAIIVVQKVYVEDTIDSLLAKNVKSIILITAGFKETGKEGEELEKKILSKIKSAGARLIGPNCMGVISTLSSIKLNATFVAEEPQIGAVGFLSQSGAIGAAVLNSLRETNIRFAHFISVGNKADLNENDFLHFWQKDDNIKTLAFYLESFVKGEEFIVPFIKGEITKPAIILKSGRTASGIKAASSHTGALGSSDKVVEAVLKQFGIIRAESIDELFNTTKGLENFPFPKGNKVCVVTNSGGPAIIAVDSLAKEGLELAELSEETKNKVREFIHVEGSAENPIDLLPGGNGEIFKSVIETVIEDKNVDAVVSIFIEPVMVIVDPIVESINSIDSTKPIYQIIMPLPEFWNRYKGDKPIFRNAEDPAKVLSNILFFSKSKEKERNKSIEMLQLKNSKKISSKNLFLTQDESLELANQYSIPAVKSLSIPADKLSKTEIDFYPVVIKGISSDVIHKSELDAVKLNIKNVEELCVAAKSIENNFSNKNYKVDSYLIQSFLKPKHEILIGGFRDPSFGPMIMFGSGGKYVEVFDDTSLKSAYLSDDDIDDMINSTNMGKILKGVRGETPADIKRLKEIIYSSAKMLVENNNIIEFDFNPMIFTEDGDFSVVDIRIKLSENK
ncbi:MAG: acetate--CoA ligase family protein [Melioribacteraceae bacterium]|nr:acetate--CoA ligase family protein [Melioribacteraceae bacterium]